MRVLRIEAVETLSPAAREVVGRLEAWLDSTQRKWLRVYWLDDGMPLVAPWNPNIQPGMRITAVVSEAPSGTPYAYGPDRARSGAAEQLRFAVQVAELP